MKKIPNTFRFRGFDYNLIKRAGMVALYSQSRGGCIDAYEVHKVRLKAKGTGKYAQPDGTFNIVEYPEKEILASNEEFGYFGWTHFTLDTANLKFQEQIRKEEEKKKDRLISTMP